MIKYECMHVMIFAVESGRYADRLDVMGLSFWIVMCLAF